MKPDLSIVVPVYNVENFIKDCIDSILAQTFADFELILINDGSTDSSGTICDYYSTLDTRIKVIHKRNEGPSVTRNLGIDIAQGEFIGFVDSDDTLDSSMYEKMFATAVKHKADIVACGYKESDEFRHKTKSYINPLGEKNILKNNSIKLELEFFLNQQKCIGYASMCTKLYNRDFLIKNNLRVKEKLKIAEDQCFNIVAFSFAQTVCSINEDLYIYRRINYNSIMNRKSDNFYLHLEARKEWINTVKNLNISSVTESNVIRYENYKTVASYLAENINILKAQSPIKFKLKEINRLIHEEFLMEALDNYETQEFKFKAKILIAMAKLYLKIKVTHKKFST